MEEAKQQGSGSIGIVQPGATWDRDGDGGGGESGALVLATQERRQRDRMAAGLTVACRSSDGREGPERQAGGESGENREGSVDTGECGNSTDVDWEGRAELDGEAVWAAGNEGSKAGDSNGIQEVWQQGGNVNGPTEVLRVTPKLPRMPRTPWLSWERQFLLEEVYVDAYTVEEFCVYDQGGVPWVFFTGSIW
jgi:hypothetical protein